MGQLVFEPGSGRLMKVSDPSNSTNDGKLQTGTWRFMTPPADNSSTSGMYWGESVGWTDSSGNYSEAMGYTWNNCIGGFYGDWPSIGSYPTHLWWPSCDVILDSGTGWGEYQTYCWYMRCCFMKYYIPATVRNASIKKVLLWWYRGGGAGVSYRTNSAQNFRGAIYNPNMVVRAKLTTSQPATVSSITENYHGSIALDTLTNSCIIPPQSSYSPSYEVVGSDGNAPYPYFLRSNKITTLSANTHNMFSGTSIYLSWHFAYLQNAVCPNVSAQFPHAVDVFTAQPPYICVLV